MKSNTQGRSTAAIAVWVNCVLAFADDGPHRPADAAMAVEIARFKARNEQVIAAAPVQAVGVDFDFDFVVADAPVAEVVGVVADDAVEAVEAVAVPILGALFGNPVGNDDQAMIKQFEDQFAQQLRPALRTELTFVRLNAEIPPDQRKPIKAAAEAGVKLAARALAEFQQQQMRGGRIQQKAQPNPQKMIRDRMFEVLKTSLPEEQLARLQAEQAQRDALRKNAAILCAIARLDGALCLSAVQRDQIRQAIDSGWQPHWEGWLMLQQYGEHYFPFIPENLIVKYLNPEQKIAFDGLQKINFSFQQDWDGQAVQEDDWWDGGSGKPAPRGPQGVLEFIQNVLMQ